MRFGPAGDRRRTEAAAALWAGSDVRATVVRLREAEASEAAFKALAPGFRVLHLATHGFFLDGTGPAPRPAKASAVSAVSFRRKRPSKGSGRGASLRLSGLALAGANRGDG